MTMGRSGNWSASVLLRVLVVVGLAVGVVGCESAPTTGGGAASRVSSKEVLAQAQEQFVAGNYTSANELFERVWKADDRSFEAVEGMVRCYEAMGEVRTLVHRFWSQARSSPQSATLEYGLGLGLLLESKFEEASRRLNNALELAPGNPWVLYARGELFRAVGSDEAARKDLEAVIRRQPRHGPALTSLAILKYRRDKNDAEVIELLKQAVTSFRPIERAQQVAAYVFLGRLYASRRQYEQALEQFRTARNLDLATTYTLVNVGAFLADLGRTEEADREWDATVRESGADSPTGLDVLRARRRRAGDLVDVTHLLAGAPVSDYETLIAHIGSPRRLPSLPVDEVLRPYIPPFHDLLIDVSDDLDGDGKRERLLLDAIQSDKAFPDQFLVSDAVVRLFSADGGDPYVLPTRFEHFYKLLVRDLDGDGRKEVLVVGIRETNKLVVSVLAELPVGYGLSLVGSVVCSNPWAGCLVTDLDGDGRREMLFISGEDGWVDIYRWQRSRPTPANADFPEFYQAFLARWGRTPAQELARRPGLARKIRLARAYRSAASRSRATPREQEPPRE